MESQCKFYLSRKIDAVALRNLWFIYIFTSIYKFITKTALNNKVYCYGKKNLPRVPLYRSIVMGEKIISQELHYTDLLSWDIPIIHYTNLLFTDLLLWEKKNLSSNNSLYQSIINKKKNPKKFFCYSL